ncbi:MAG: ATP-binding protein [Gemmataceae bacterium]|nr:ATP-binding protein [Gemmataceae bacterium]
MIARLWNWVSRGTSGTVAPRNGAAAATNAPAATPPPVRRRQQASLWERLLAAKLDADLHWLQATASLRKLLGASLKKLRRTSILDWIHPDDRPVLERRFRNPSKVPFDARLRLVAPLGTKQRERPIQIVQLSAAPWRDPAGVVCRWRCVFVDLTRQIQAEDARHQERGELMQLRDRYERLQKQFDRLKDSYFDLYHNAPVMYFSLDDAGQFVTFNDTLLRTLGYRREELLGRKYADIVVPGSENQAAFQHPSDKEVEWETQWRRRDGQAVDIWLRAVAVFDEQGRFVRWRSSALDFTERNRLAKELRAQAEEMQRTNARLRHINSELEDFTHVVSHDLKEPLRTLQAYSHLLAEDFSSQLSTDGFQYVNHLLQASRRLGQLIDNLLTLSQAGRTSRPPTAFDLIEVVATVRRDLVDLIQRKEATVLTAGPLPRVFGDPQRITQLLTNLVANGLKYNKSASPEVVIGQASQGSNDRQVVIFVRDNGIGIDPRDHDKIFELFRRVHHSGDYEGTGAGLAICKKIVEAHGGRIWVESQVGKGATFYFTLPRPTAAWPQKTAPGPPKPPAAPRQRDEVRGKHVLLVEDVPEIGQLVQRIGQRSGINVTWFATAEQAWDWLQDAHPDFLLLDINLPGMNGLELCRRIRQELRRDTPIAIFSQEQSAEAQNRLREYGANYFLSKDLLAQPPVIWQRKLDELLAKATEPAAHP